MPGGDKKVTHTETNLQLKAKRVRQMLEERTKLVQILCKAETSSFVWIIPVKIISQ